MFIPVQVEIISGAICVGILPVRIDSKSVTGLPLAFQDMFRAECVETKITNGDKLCKMDFTQLTGNYEWVPEFRITDFTFGGVMVANPKFDPYRIDAEDEAWLKKHLPPAPARPKKGQLGSVAPGMNKP